MDIKRRGFFGALIGAGSTAAAAKVLADCPQPESVKRIEASANAVYVVEYDGYLRSEAVNRIRNAWNEALGPNAPRVLVLTGGLKLKRMD